MSICSGQEYYQTCEVWGRLDIVCRSYSSFLFHGESSKFVRPPWTHRLMKTQHVHNFNIIKAFRLDWPKKIIKCHKISRSRLLQCKTCQFLLPAGGAMAITEFGHVDMFRSGVLSNMWSLGQIGHCMSELQQLPFLWRNIEICRAATDTPFNETSRSSQFNIAKAFRIHWQVWCWSE